MLTGLVCVSFRPCRGNVAYIAFLAYGNSCFSLHVGSSKLSVVPRADAPSSAVPFGLSGSTGVRHPRLTPSAMMLLYR